MEAHHSGAHAPTSDEESLTAEELGVEGAMFLQATMKARPVGSAGPGAGEGLAVPFLSHTPQGSQAKHWRNAGWQDEKNNPHVRQAWLNAGAGYTCRRDMPFTRVLGPDAPRAPYRRRKEEVKSVVHWGQRKLLLSEMEFLTLHGSANRFVVYAGAAPGTHLTYLSELFPDFTFIGVDPAPFTAKPSSRLILRQELFTDELASEFTGLDVLFISDVRSADPERMTDDEVDAHVAEDMDAQMRWHSIMQPVRSMLKFRLPWKAGQTRYLDGDILLPVWGPITTTEARLVTGEDRNAVRVYDNTVYEEQMFFFNTVQRVALYPHDVVGEGLDCCYDCRAEVHILSEYLRKIRGVADPASLLERVSSMSAEISRSLGKSFRRTLADDNRDPDERRGIIAKRQWINGKPAHEHAKEQTVKKAEPFHDERAMKMMLKSGFVPGRGLGKNEQGNMTPLNPTTAMGTEGVGFTLRHAAQQALSGLFTPPYASSQVALGSSSDHPQHRSSDGPHCAEES